MWMNVLAQIRTDFVSNPVSIRGAHLGVPVILDLILHVMRGQWIRFSHLQCTNARNNTYSGHVKMWMSVLDIKALICVLAHVKTLMVPISAVS